MLVISLIYSTIAKAVTIDSVVEYWFVVTAAFYVIVVSYAVSSLLHYSGLLRIKSQRDFCALQVSAAFPNIVALPILIFPSLCEYAVVYEAFSADVASDATDAELQGACEDQSTAMIFCYFFSWSLCFWTVGYPQLMNATRMRGNNNNDNSSGESPTATTSDKPQEQQTFLQNLYKAVKQTVTAPGFIAMALGFLTACIPPLQSALFDSGGALRFLGAAFETLGRASSPISTMVVAASLVPIQEGAVASVAAEDEESTRQGGTALNDTVAESANVLPQQQQQQEDVDAIDEEEMVIKTPLEESGKEPHYDTIIGDDIVVVESPIMSDPNFGPYQRRKSARKEARRLSQAVVHSSRRFVKAATRSTPDMRRLHIWFVLSRLILSPAVVVATVVGLDCGGLLGSVPALAKLVVIVNSALPGALVVVVLLKSSSDLAETASAVARVYLPSYALAIITITGWTAVGMYVTIPDVDGKSFCAR